jgi:MOSC domain-containing protein YiiM
LELPEPSDDAGHGHDQSDADDEHQEGEARDEHGAHRNSRRSLGPARVHQEARQVIEVVGVNIGTPRILHEQGGERVYSAIAKRPVALGTALWLSFGNLAGDAQADLSVHGGPDKAVYAYPSEHLAAWSAELDETLGSAAFGENLSIAGALEPDAGIGDVWRWGDALLQVCQPRWPCFKLALHRGRSDIQARMRANGRTGWYLRVLQPGEVAAGDPIEVVEQDPARLTIADAHVAMSDRRLARRDLVQRLADHAALAAEWRQPLIDRLAR